MNKVLSMNFFDGTGKIKYKQVVVPPATVRQIIQSLHNDALHGHPGKCKMLQELRKQNY